MSETTVKKAGRNLLRTIVIIVAILLVYAIAVQVTDINLEKPLDPGRQENLVRVLRLLADPDIIEIEESTGNWVLSEAARITIERIIETIFMALMASAVGTVLAVPFAFLAARNLMEPITSPLAAVMAAVVAGAIGGGAGLLAAQQLASLSDRLVETAVVGLASMAVAVGLFFLVTRVGPPIVTEENRSTSMQVLSLLRILLALMFLIYALNIAAWMGKAAGIWLEDNLGPFDFLGNFVFVLADLLAVALPLLTALFSALVAASIGNRYGQEAVLSWKLTPSKILTGLSTFLGTAVIIYSVSAIIGWLFEFDLAENWILWAAIIGGGMAAVVATFLFPWSKRIIRTLAFFGSWLGAGAISYFSGSLLSTAFNFSDPSSWAIVMALVGGIPIAVLALIVDPRSPLGLGFAIYTITRSLLNVLRSIEPLIMGIVFVVWVSLGPFAGILALTLHSIAALGKLFSEQVEGIDDGPVEAILATGASRLQMVRYAVIPQVIPPFTAFALYRWDINVRMSTIIGFVGGGGIGFVLSQNISRLRYRQASVMMLSIAIVVALLDYASARIRSRII